MLRSPRSSDALLRPGRFASNDGLVAIELDYWNKGRASRRYLQRRTSQPLPMQLNPLTEQVRVDAMFECEPRN
jgi:hypothetical protein